MQTNGTNGKPICRACSAARLAFSISISFEVCAALSSTAWNRPSVSESIQFEFFEYVYHHVLRQDDEWAAREWFRENYRAHQAAVLGHRYDHRSIGCICLYTTPQVMLDELIADRSAPATFSPPPTRSSSWAAPATTAGSAGHWSSPSIAAAHAVTRSSLIESATRVSYSIETRPHRPFRSQVYLCRQSSTFPLQRARDRREPGYRGRHRPGPACRRGSRGDQPP